MRTLYAIAVFLAALGAESGRAQGLESIAETDNPVIYRNCYLSTKATSYNGFPLIVSNITRNASDMRILERPATGELAEMGSLEYDATFDLVLADGWDLSSVWHAQNASFYIREPNGDRCLHMDGTHRNPGYIRMATCNGTNAQKFKLPNFAGEAYRLALQNKWPNDTDTYMINVGTDAVVRRMSFDSRPTLTSQVGFAGTFGPGSNLNLQCQWVIGVFKGRDLYARKAHWSSKPWAYAVGGVGATAGLAGIFKVLKDFSLKSRAAKSYVFPGWFGVPEISPTDTTSRSFPKTKLMNMVKDLDNMIWEAGASNPNAAEYIKKLQSFRGYLQNKIAGIAVGAGSAMIVMKEVYEAIHGPIGKRSDEDGGVDEAAEASSAASPMAAHPAIVR